MRFLSDGAQGFRFPFQSVSFLFQHRTLWKWALLPALVNVVVFAAAFAVFLGSDVHVMLALHLGRPKTAKKA
jgi:hypothetical protein